ncbi:uncharacterized protein LOC133197269 [Saccostrea echinata]|uniref:uncharacterized protein LOC133197269 n=1 Tax=Saccostrea echinata TaxID=191078 RepID=UPI002A819D5A|nr:uncharacterized protein LOC133197269 [Saccostrea echinata]
MEGHKFVALIFLICVDLHYSLTQDTQLLGPANLDTLNREVRRHLLSTITRELSTVKKMIDSMQPKMADCQNKTHALMGDCIHCVNDLCQNRIRKCRGITKVLLPATGGVSVSNHQNEAGESIVKICSILRDNSRSCQTIMNPDGIMVSSISNMGNTLQVHLQGAVNDLGGNVGTFINGMQTFIGGFSPSKSSLNASEWQALQRAGEQYGRIANEMGQQMTQMGMEMGRSMNDFAQGMNQGMNQMAMGLTDMFNNMAASFGQWNVPNGAPGVVNINSQIPGNSHSVVNINSNIGSYQDPVVQSPVNLQQVDMRMPEFPSTVNINSQIHTQNNIPNSPKTLHNHQPVSSSSVVRINNKVYRQKNNNVPHVLNIDTHIQNKNGKAQRNQNLNMGNSFGAFDGHAFAANMNNYMTNLFSNIFGRKKRAVPTFKPTTTTSATPSLKRFKVKSRRSRRRNSKSRKSGTKQRFSTTTTTPAPVSPETAPKTAAAPTTTPSLPTPAVKVHSDQLASQLEQTIVDRFTQPSKETPKVTTVVIDPPKTSELSFDPEVISQKLGTTEKIPNSHDDSPALQALLGVILPEEAYDFPMQSTTVAPITPISLGLEDLFKSMTVPPKVDSSTDVPDCGTIVIDPDSCARYKSQCATCANYIDKNKGDILQKVCGTRIVKNGNKLTEKLEKLNEVYDQVISSSNFITEVEFQRSNIDPVTLTVPGMKVRALVRGKPLRFSSKAPLYVFDMTKTAKTLSKQIWQYWSPNSVLDYCLFAAVLLVSAVVGLYYFLKEKFGKKEMTADDLLMGGRDMGVFPVAMSLVASYMSAITVLGVPTEMYVYGTQYFLVGFSGLMTYPATCFIFLPFFHNLGLTSAYQYLELRFNRWTRCLASFVFVLEMILYMAVVLYAPALALNQVTGLSLWGSIVSVGVVVTFYTSLGGLRAVVWTDTFQTFVVVGGLIGIIIMGSNKLGGIGEVWRISQEGERIEFFDFDFSPFKRCTFWGLIVGSFIGQLTIYGSSQTMLQRYMSISNVRKSQLALFVSLPTTILLVALVCVAGLVIYATYHACDPLLDGKIISRDQLLPYYVMESLGGIPGVPGIFVACIFSASLSSISSCLNAVSITILEDLVKPAMEYFDKTMCMQTEARLAKFLGILGGVLVIAFAFLCTILGSTVLQGALAALILSTVIMFWIVIGSFVYEVPMPVLPFSTEGCIADESTVSYIFNAFTTHISDLSHVIPHTVTTTLAPWIEWSGFKMIYSISFLWYPTVALFVALVVGIFVSCVTGWTKQPTSSRFVYPVAEKLCCCFPYQARWQFNKLFTYNVLSAGGEELLTDEEDEDTNSSKTLKMCSRETARLLPKETNRLDSFETELDVTTPV